MTLPLRVQRFLQIKIKKMKKRFPSLLYSCLFTVTTILSFPKVTLAQLRLGTGVPQGLEGYLLEYQERGLPLNELSSASGCSAGFGASCNKTGAILQKIIEENSGLSYQKLLTKAAGGTSNYRRFVRLYSNPSAVPLIPYSSFWHKGNEYVLDSYKNTGIGSFDEGEFSSLKEITSKFKYAPATWGNDNISLRQSLVGLKTSYGLTLIEEALKIPDINQKIAEVSLNESEASFHQRQFQTAASTLNYHSPEQLTNAIFYLLSNPYTEVEAPLNRPNLHIAEDIAQVHGITLEGKVENIFAITGEGTEAFLPTSFDEIMEDAAPSAYALMGVGGVALIILLATGGDVSNGNESLVASVGDILTLGNDNKIAPDSFLPEDKGTSGKKPTTSGIIGENQLDNQIEEVNATEVPEPSNKNALFILLSVFFLFNRKKVMI